MDVATTACRKVLAYEGRGKYLEETSRSLVKLGLTCRENSGVYTGEWQPVKDGVLFFGSEDPCSRENICLWSEEEGAKEVEVAVNTNLVRDSYEPCLEAMTVAMSAWKQTAPPVRGEVVRLIGESVRKHKEDLAVLVAMENGKIVAEARGEVQEFIDICDFAVGLSRQLEGKVLPSERADHMLLESYHPLGIVGVVTAFNFPVAVFGWNLAIALVCGNCVLWKPSDTTTLTSIALINIIHRALQPQYATSGSGHLNIPKGIVCLCVDAPTPLVSMLHLVPPRSTHHHNYDSHIVAKLMVNDKRMQLISFTGSSKVGVDVGKKVMGRFGKVLLELGGNNASVVLPDADLEMVVRGVLFSAVGTCGQRCTSLRRLIVHADVYDEAVLRLVKAYQSVPIGWALQEGVLCGPLHCAESVTNFCDVIENVKVLGGRVLCGGEAIGGNFVSPALVEVPEQNTAALKEAYGDETFGPLLYVFKTTSLEEAIKLNNEVEQGLSSSLYTNNIRNIYKWIGPMGSDCGIVNVNIGPSGAEIGGAFGGEKHTGGGREAGSDAWKQYMRRSTCTINCSTSLPLAQGVKFDVVT
eukprot:GHVS01088011.1.p1 GENE.GHVS01088011.1~~GHVS01088011.1.p1  ORF type:complete len:581 (+),score=65.44 GHVS01088011.1:76-1818(+)